jgi:hypothetical protein
MDKQFIIVLFFIGFLLVAAIGLPFLFSPYQDCSVILRTSSGKVIDGTVAFLNVPPFDTLQTDAFGWFRFRKIPKEAGKEALLTVCKDTQIILKQKVTLNEHNYIILERK